MRNVYVGNTYAKSGCIGGHCPRSICIKGAYIINTHCIKCLANNSCKFVVLYLKLQVDLIFRMIISYCLCLQIFLNKILYYYFIDLIYLIVYLLFQLVLIAFNIVVI